MARSALLDSNCLKNRRIINLELSSCCCFCCCRFSVGEIWIVRIGKEIERSSCYCYCFYCCFCCGFSGGEICIVRIEEEIGKSRCYCYSFVVVGLVTVERFVFVFGLLGFRRRDEGVKEEEGKKSRIRGWRCSGVGDYIQSIPDYALNVFD